MKLYLVQHGNAVSKEQNPDRPLSDKGAEDVARMAAFMEQTGTKVNRVIHSGKTRAQQTAEALAMVMLEGSNIEGYPEINPNDKVDSLLTQISNWTNNTLVVGHLPYMAKLVSRLVDVSHSDHAVTFFTPGTMVCLEKDECDRWGIIWMLRPELLKRQ